MSEGEDPPIAMPPIDRSIRSQALRRNLISLGQIQGCAVKQRSRRGRPVTSPFPVPDYEQMLWRWQGGVANQPQTSLGHLRRGPSASKLSRSCSDRLCSGPAAASIFCTAHRRADGHMYTYADVCAAGICKSYVLAFNYARLTTHHHPRIDQLSRTAPCAAPLDLVVATVGRQTRPSSLRDDKTLALAASRPEDG